MIILGFISDQYLKKIYQCLSKIYKKEKDLVLIYYFPVKKLVFISFWDLVLYTLNSNI